MHTQINKKVIGAPVADVPIVVANIESDANAMSQSIADVRQETQIWTTFELNPYLRAHDIKVFVHDGTATLTGFVAEGVNKELAKLIALGVNGVTHVDNRIFVEADYIAPAPSAERSYAETIDDANITAAIKSKLMWSQYSNGLSTDVDTAWGKVTLTGTVDCDVAMALAGRLALHTPGVVSVDNRLEIGLSRSVLEHNAAIASNVKARDIADSWISTKVRSTFLYSSNISSHGIIVETHDGIVSLSGKTGSGIERVFAIELAQHVRGVKGVNADSLMGF